MPSPSSPDRTLALGGGATSRVDPVHAARAKAERVGIALQGSVLASDAFFPFPDGIETAAAAGAWRSCSRAAACAMTR
jgi:phosphoribosylaminoimidazolecarboxamide formyltransferase/IMP cyclohydrolase